MTIALVHSDHPIWLLQEKLDHIGIIALILGTPITALLVSVLSSIALGLEQHVLQALHAHISLSAE